MDAYLDNAIVSGLARDQLESEQSAAERLLDLHEAGEIRLYTSRVTKEEIERIRAPANRKPKEAMAERVLRLPEVPEIRYLTPISATRPFMGPVEDGRLSELRAIVSDYDDARHLFHAIGNDLPYFVTRDGGVLHHHQRLLDDFGVTVLQPSALLEIAERQTS